MNLSLGIVMVGTSGRQWNSIEEDVALRLKPWNAVVVLFDHWLLISDEIEDERVRLTGYCQKFPSIEPPWYHSVRIPKTPTWYENEASRDQPIPHPLQIMPFGRIIGVA
jgi:hypothetical protein